MDFHAAMETFAEAWVAANTQTPVNSDNPQTLRPTPLEQLPTMLSKEQLEEGRPPEGSTSTQESPCQGGAVDMMVKTLGDHKLPPTQLQLPGLSAKSIPIHCVVETLVGSHGDGTGNATINEPTVELDTYAILPSTTLFSEIVRTALVKLGYTAAEAMGAKGAVQIKHWKPLTFDTITENPDSTVDEILGDLTSVTTLRIRLCSRSKHTALEEVKEKLLTFLLQHSQSVLLTTGCPIEKTTLSQITKGEYLGLADDTRQAFDKWYLEQTKKLPKPAHQEPTTAVSRENRFETSSSAVATSYPTLRSELSNSFISRSRIRTSFDPEHEIPRLHRWFQDNQHPTRDQMIVFLNELNSLDSRRGRKPLDLTNIIYWFKNARAAQRRSHPRPGENMGEDRSFELDENIDERLSPCSADQVPVLPNKNAVYVVSNPLHHSSMPQPGEVRMKQPDSPVVAVFPQDPVDVPMETNEIEAEDLSNNKTVDIQNAQSQNNNNKENDASAARDRSESLDSLGSNDGTESDLDIESENIRPMNGQHIRFKLERDDKEYDSSNATTPSPLTSSPSLQSLPQPPPAHQQALHLAAMRSPMNVQYIHPATAHALYGLEGSPLLANHSFDSLNTSLSEEARKKRSRVFIDPLSEIPKLERWFIEDTHPSSYMIEKYTDELNRSEYRQRFPKLEPKNVQLWFKNHRAKVKRARLE